MYIDENKRRFLRVKFKTSDDISTLEELSRLIEEAIKSECSILSDKIEAEKVNRTQDEKDYIDGWYEDEFMQLQEEFPMLQRYALFTTALSTVESNIVSLCNTLQEIMNLTVYNKPKADIINHAIKYLKKNTKIDISRLSYYIDELNMLKETDQPLTLTLSSLKVAIKRHSQGMTPVFLRSGQKHMVSNRNEIERLIEIYPNPQL